MERSYKHTKSRLSRRGAKVIKKYTADFETVTWLEDETWVWAYAICDIDNSENVEIGNNIDDFMVWCENSGNSILYFHNLKFDGEFILYYLLTHGFSYVKNKKDKKDKTFTTIISKMGQFFAIEVYFKVANKKVKKVTFYDSLKILPFSVDDIAKSFKLSISKLKIDYNLSREVGHILTKQEENYIKNDVRIVAQALKVLFDEDLTKMTQASNALYNYKQMIKKNRFEHFFPVLDKIVDENIRASYKGGFTYINPIYAEKDVDSGIVLDVNSLYPRSYEIRKNAIWRPYIF